MAYNYSISTRLFHPNCSSVSTNVTTRLRLCCYNFLLKPYTLYIRTADYMLLFLFFRFPSQFPGSNVMFSFSSASSVLHFQAWANFILHSLTFFHSFLEIQIFFFLTWPLTRSASVCLSLSFGLSRPLFLSFSTVMFLFCKDSLTLTFLLLCQVERLVRLLKLLLVVFSLSSTDLFLSF